VENKTVVITGAGRGIGRACALRFAKAGANLTLASRTQEQIDQVAKEIGPKTLVVATDVADQRQVERLFIESEKTWGCVDLLINNAGFLEPAPFDEITLEVWEKTFAINVRGSFLCAQQAFRQMKKRSKGGGGGGHIINISSLAGIRGAEKFPGFTAYTAAKHAVVGLTENLAAEGRVFDIRANCIAPGAVDTEMLRANAPGLETRTSPEDMANIIFNISQDSVLNGAIIEDRWNG